MIEIIGNGYAKDIEIGQSYLAEQVISMWETIPNDVYSYYNGTFQYVIIEITKISDQRLNYRQLLKSEISEELLEAIKTKYNTSQI